MKQYIISEEELHKLFGGYCEECLSDTINDFLKSKTPIEAIAEGKLESPYITLYEVIKLLENVPDKDLDQYKGKKVRILIEEIE